MKPRIRVSYPPNPSFGWGHQTWTTQLIEYLKNTFTVEVQTCTYHNHSIEFETLAYTNGKYDKKDYIRDTEIVIENFENYEIVVASFSESLHDINQFILNPYLKEFYFTHYSEKTLSCFDNAPQDMKSKQALIKPFFGLDLFTEYNQYNYSSHRINYSPENAECDQMFCKARNTHGEHAFRQTLAILEEKYPSKFNSLDYVTYDQYLDQLKKSKLALSYASDFGVYYMELCHRDMDYAMVGVPFIRVEYKNTLWKPLDPDVHYISIPYEKAYAAFEENGNNGVARVIIDKYDEVKDDHDFLMYISNNLTEWFDNYASPDSSIQMLVKDSIISNWSEGQNTRHLL